MLMRVLPPANVQGQTITLNGRTYTCAPGAYLDVMDADAYPMCANGWFLVAQVGSTAERPTTEPNHSRISAGRKFLDTTLGAMLVYDGQSWRNMATGAIV